MSKIGKVLWWSQIKGYGVILSEGEKYYIHVMKLAVTNTRLPRIDDQVRFHVGRPAREEGRLVEALDAEIIDVTTAQEALAGKANESVEVK